MTPEMIAEEIEGGRHLVPDRLWPGLRRYFVDQVEPGGFLLALLANDLRAAVGRVDETNESKLRDLVQFLYNFAPGGSHGSYDAVEGWLGRKVGRL